MADNLPDPINPENDPIVDGMRRDGEFFRDVAEGKTASEIVFDVEMGTAERRAEEHDALMADIGEVIKAEAPPADASAAFEDIPELDTPVTEEAPKQPITPTSEIQAIHTNLMDDMVKAAEPENKRQEIKNAIQRRAINARHRTPEQRQKLMSEHGELFVAANKTVADAEPPAGEDGAVKPDVAARIAHPGKEKNEELGGVMAAYAEADKARWESLFDVLELLKEYALQDRLQLDEILAQLERGRL